MKLIREQKHFSIILILLAGLFIRIYNLGARDLWYDEAVSYGAAKMLPASLKFNSLLEPHPPLYYYILSIWMRYIGEGEFSLRFLSVIFGIISILLTYKIGDLCGKNKIAIVASFLMAVSPIHIWFSQEARAYAMLTSLLLARAYFFLQSLINNRASSWKFFTIFTILSIYANYFALIILLPEITILVFKKDKILFKKCLLCYMAILICSIPSLQLFLKHLEGIKSSFWIPKPSLNNIFTTFTYLTLGYNANRFIQPSTYICLILAVIGMVNQAKYKTLPLLFIIFLLLPIFCIFLISQFIPVYLDRYFISLAPFYYILIACGLISIINIGLRIILSIFLILSLISAFYNYFSDYLSPKEIASGIFIKMPFKPAINYIKHNLEEDDIIGHTNPSTQWSFFYYMVRGKKDIDIKKEIKYIFYLFAPMYLDKYWRRLLTRKMSIPPSINISNGGLEYLTYKRIWLISAAWNRRDLDSNSIEIKRFISKGHNLISAQNIDGINVYLYTKDANQR